MTIKIAHKGEDYYGVEWDGKYGEVNLTQGQTLKLMLKTIKLMLSDNPTFS